MNPKNGIRSKIVIINFLHTSSVTNVGAIKKVGFLSANLQNFDMGNKLTISLINVSIS